MSFEARQYSLNNLFNKKVYTIPRNQRKYVWTKDNWEDLKNDLDFIINTNSKKNHFIGSIVLISGATKNGISKYTIIDGQQRTFTILLVLTTIAQLFKEFGDKDNFAGLCDIIYPKDISNKQHCAIETDYHYSLKNIIQNVVEWENYSIPINKLLSSSIIDKKKDTILESCMLYYYKELKGRSIEDIKKFRDVLLATSYVEIVASSEEDSYTIFEILNARGQKLEDHELLKNYIMRYIQPQDNSVIDEVKGKWKEYLDKPLGASLSRYFQHYAKHRYTYTDENQKNIYSIIKRNVGTEINGLFDDLVKKAAYYKMLLTPMDSSYAEELSDTEKFVFNFFNKRKAVQFRPTLLSLIEQKVSGGISVDDYEKVLNHIYNFWVCYNIIGEEKSNKLEDVIRKYSPQLHEKCDNKSISDFISGLYRRLPSKQVFVNSVCNLGWSNHNNFHNESKNKERVRIVLELIERYYHGPSDSFSIEHANPDSASIENALLGNLLPLEKDLNERLKDKPLSEKISFYKQSNYQQTRRFAERYGDDLSKFNPNNRAKLMAELIYDKILSLKPSGNGFFFFFVNEDTHQ